MNKFIELFTQTLKKWKDDDGITDSAALSFHLLLSLPADYETLLFKVEPVKAYYLDYTKGFTHRDMVTY
ncbi:hypothetical protein V7O66_02535 [Methanolobus sp. ZRKC3]|uniref:hypothetical protein n=1 Tax=Methanolobus sp. ZRKC3 TaxID=3125786 RepID=UPI00324C8F9D